MIPVYNREEYIGMAIDSVLKQTYKNFELIVHDDASTDNTPGVLALYHDPRLKIIRTKQNHGMIGGWNYLLKKAKGEFVKQMGSDDLLAPNCIELQVKALLEHPLAAMTTCQRRVIDERGVTLTTYQFAKKTTLVSGNTHAHWILTNLRENKIGEPCAVLFRRNLIEKAGLFDPRFSQFADFEYWIRLLQFGDLYYDHVPLCSFRTHSGSNTSAAILDGRFITEIFTLIHKYYKDPFFVKTFELTKKDRYEVTKLKTLDTLKNIKDLLMAGEIYQSLKYFSRLTKSFLRI